MWLSDNYGEYFESTEGLLNINSTNKFFIFGMFPFLSYKELHGNWQTAVVNELINLIHNNPGRQDLFETYARQELPFNGRSTNLDWKPTPINYLVKFFEDIISDANVGANLLKFLHDHGSDVNASSGDGSIPLSDAILARNVPLTKMLLELGADADEPKNHGPIFNALFWCGASAESDNPLPRLEIADMLLDRKVNVNVVCNDYTLLMQSLFIRTPGITAFISRLIKAGANVNAQDSNGLTILMQAVINYAKCTDSGANGYLYEIVELLLKCRAKPNVLNNKGYWSPLMYANSEKGIICFSIFL